MAHSCPDCGAACHCGGDIDDIFFEDGDEEALCAHCADAGDFDHDSENDESVLP